MVESCSVVNCYSRRTKGVIMKFHRIPKDPNLRKLWLHAIGRINFVPSKTAVICEKHFTLEDYEIIHGNRVLKRKTLPSVFDYSSHLEQDIKSKKPSKRKIKMCNKGDVSTGKRKLRSTAVPSLNLPTPDNEQNFSQSTLPGSSTSYITPIQQDDHLPDYVKDLYRNVFKCCTFVSDNQIGPSQVIDQQWQMPELTPVTAINSVNQETISLPTLVDETSKETDFADTFNFVKNSLDAQPKQLIFLCQSMTDFDKKLEAIDTKLKEFADTLDELN